MDINMRMSREQITVEQIKEIPESSWELPPGVTYVRLGCTACRKAVCLKATGLKPIASWARPLEGADDFREIIGEVPKRVSVRQGYTDVSYLEGDECADGDACGQAEEVQAAVELLNERFGVDIQPGRELPSTPDDDGWEWTVPAE
jgi:hypothetical protein